MNAKSPFLSFSKRFWSCEQGATAIEYGLILALIFLVIITAVTRFAEVGTDKMGEAETAIVNAG